MLLSSAGALAQNLLGSASMMDFSQKVYEKEIDELAPPKAWRRKQEHPLLFVNL
jgi:hypothetical protein